MGVTAASLPDDVMGRLQPFGLIPAADDVSRYGTDWSGDIVGRPRAVVRPRTADEVAAVVRICADERIPVVPQGGHTGLVGGATPTADATEVVVSLERLSKIRSIDPLNFSMVVEAGCILADIHTAAAETGRMFPLHLGAEGSCQIGGNIATNAGGINVLRYGMTRDLVLGLEVVLADGTIWNGLSQLRKDNTGYDLKQLFLGAEGTLGIVTAAAIKVFPLATQVETAVLAVSSPAAALRLYERARCELCDLLSAFEILTRDGIDLALSSVPTLRDPLPGPSTHYVLMEVSGSGRVDIRGLCEEFLAAAFEAGTVVDGVVASGGEQARAFWRVREGIIEAQALRGRHLRTDVSIPISAIADFLRDADAAIAEVDETLRPLAYGHIGDGNLHYNVVPPATASEAEKIALLSRCEDAIFSIVDRMHGSISAEHGIGRVKRHAFLDRVSPIELGLLERLKTVLDPLGILNPGRILEARASGGSRP